MDSTDIILYVGYALVALGAIFAVILPLIKSLDNPKSLLKTGLGVVLILVLFFISYSISSNEVLPQFQSEPFNLTPGMSQFVGGCLITTYLLVIGAVAGIIITEISKAVK